MTCPSLSAILPYPPLVSPRLPHSALQSCIRTVFIFQAGVFPSQSTPSPLSPWCLHSCGRMMLFCLFLPHRN